MISEESVQLVKDTATVYDIISDRLKIKKAGKDYECKCPFHNEKTPSFKVSKSKDIFKCFGCGKSGDAITFVMEYDNVGYIEAIRRLAAFYGIELEMASNTKEYKRPESIVINTTDPLLKYFENRAITRKTVELFKITEVQEWMPKAKAIVPTMCFPYYRGGDLINIKYRAKDKDFKLSKDAELIFFNIDSMLNGTDYVVITEGEIDCMSLVQCGIKSVVSVPNGASKGSQQLKYLDNCYEHFEKFAEVILMLDNDPAGKLLFDELARRIGKEKCRSVVYPQGCKDANDVLLNHGKTELLNMIKNRSEIPIEGIITMDDMYTDVRDYYDNGYPKGIKLQMGDFDNYLSFMPGQVTILTGIPGSGKSEFTDWMMTMAAKIHGWSWAVCSFENQPSPLHVTKIMEKFIGKSFSFRNNPYDRMSEQEFTLGTGLVDQHFHFININQIDVTLDGILSKCRELVQRKGVNGLLIDPWNYIEHKIAFGQTETQYISECLTKIKAFALTYGIHIIVIAHPTKLKKENGKYEVPTLYSISGSAHFFNKTDNGITVYRDFESSLVTIYIQKVRYSWLGKIGYVEYNYNIETRQYQ